MIDVSYSISHNIFCVIPCDRKQHVATKEIWENIYQKRPLLSCVHTNCINVLSSRKYLLNYVRIHATDFCIYLSSEFHKKRNHHDIFSAYARKSIQYQLYENSAPQTDVLKYG